MWRRAGSRSVHEDIYQPAEVTSGYLCHRVFLSTPLGTGILLSRGHTTPRLHTDISLHNQCQTGLGHMLSTEEVSSDKDAQSCWAACVFACSPLSQRSPIQPAGQLHRPVCLSHWPPFSQSHCCWQSDPNWPTSHSATQEQCRRSEGPERPLQAIKWGGKHSIIG